MREDWQYQVRIDLGDDTAEIARRDPYDPVLAPLGDILRRHNALLKSQYDAFAGYCAQAEREGIENHPLYRWTKDTIDNPAKKKKYLKAFALHADGDEVYAKDKADALERDLAPLVGGGIVTRLSKHDTDPAKNPQPPRKYR